MATPAKKTKSPAKASNAPAARRRRPAAKTARKPVRRRRTVKKKGMLGDMFAPNDVENGIKMLIFGGLGYFVGEYGGAKLNPDGTRNTLEVGTKLGLGFVSGTAGKMPAFGLGLAISGFKRLATTVPAVAGLGDSRDGSNRAVNYLNDAPIVIDTGMYMNDNGQMMYLNDYRGGYDSRNY